MRLFLLLCSCAALAFAPLPFPRPPKKKPGMAAIEALMGHWHNPGSPSVVVDISPTEYAFINSGRRDNVYNLVLDASKTPFKFDIQKPDGTRRFVGIWKVEGDKLTVRYASANKGVADEGRPTTFDGVGSFTETYSRKSR